ncbi:2420_t:CDS:2 [Entrophospora sp. SA101]|nr:2420_t:CDS:2 [Entrophospora sp. SA101]
MYNSTSPISSFTPSSPTLPSSSSSSNNNNDNFENNDIITSSSISIQNQRLSPIPLQRSSSLQSQPSLLIERPNTPTYTRKSTRHLSQQEPDTTAIWGWILLILTFVIFVFSMYAIVFSKLIPETGNKTLDLIKKDEYYCLLIPLTLPVTIYAIFWNWLVNHAELKNQFDELKKELIKQFDINSKFMTYQLKEGNQHIIENILNQLLPQNRK